MREGYLCPSQLPEEKPGTRREPVPVGGGGLLQDIRRVRSNNPGPHVRESYTSYFSAERAVPWQPTA
ncbi:hypothetical protein N1851_023177 [Merluccius polli]|uniref:Uncharacterized protein n=1 Tax=Merluccius polli TaxID=89951 RepID=A0AA47MGY9_MERPO|nr:hypothetical protein N1851_032908 [Merluccius polli]KAK0139901.1 hypothetical protein N1851_023177 [Merluccius polli]